MAQRSPEKFISIIKDLLQREKVPLFSTLLEKKISKNDLPGKQTPSISRTRRKMLSVRYNQGSIKKRDF